jgi:hypothetical protein
MLIASQVQHKRHPPESTLMVRIIKSDRPKLGSTIKLPSLNSLKVSNLPLNQTCYSSIVLRINSQDKPYTIDQKQDQDQFLDKKEKPSEPHLLLCTSGVGYIKGTESQRRRDQ